MENNNTNGHNAVFGWQRIGNIYIYIMCCRLEFPLHCTSALKPSCFVTCRLWRPKPWLNSGKKRRPAAIRRNICFNKKIDKTSKMMAECHENGSSKEKQLEMDNYKWGPTSSMLLFRVGAGLFTATSQRCIGWTIFPATRDKLAPALLQRNHTLSIRLMRHVT